MPATFNFTKFVPNKLKKLSTLCYRSLIHVGIVDFDGQLPRQPSNKPCNHGGAICHNSGIDVANQPTPSPGASSEGVGRGWSSRVLYKYANRPRKEIISKLSNFILIFMSSQLLLIPE
jgi:hypothetical protein